VGVLVRMICVIAAVVIALAPHAIADDNKKVAIVVVVAADSPLEDMSLDRLRALFMSETVSDPKGKTLIPINIVASAPLRVEFDRAVLNMDPDQVGQFWIDRRIRGQTPAPRSYSSPELIQRLCARMAGAVSYARADSLQPGVKAIKIDGKRVGDKGYPLAALLPTKPPAK
jgi:hypothetical protein